MTKKKEIWQGKNRSVLSRGCVHVHDKHHQICFHLYCSFHGVAVQQRCPAKAHEPTWESKNSCRGPYCNPHQNPWTTSRTFEPLPEQRGIPCNTPVSRKSIQKVVVCLYKEGSFSVVQLPWWLLNDETADRGQGVRLGQVWSGRGLNSHRQAISLPRCGQWTWKAILCFITQSDLTVRAGTHLELTFLHSHKE